MSSNQKQHLFFSSLLSLSNDKIVSGDKMMIKAKGPVWHKKDKEKGIIPKGLRGLDQ
jgi:hypothetical protein